MTSNKWIAINVVFVLVWLGLNHPLDQALGIEVGSTVDWTLYMGVSILVAGICSIGIFTSKE